MKLQTYLEFKGISKTRAAKELKIARTYVYDIINHRVGPGRKLAQRIVDWTDGAVRYEDLWEK